MMGNRVKLPCACGGELERTTLAEFDFSRYAGEGMTVNLVKAPGYRCDRCGAQTLDGEVIEEVLSKLGQAMAVGRERLGHDELRFLRKHLGLTQQELGEKLEINRVTIADWERGEQPISLMHELKLRSLVLDHGGFRGKLVEVEQALHKAMEDRIFNPEMYKAIERAITQATSIFDLVRTPDRPMLPLKAKARTRTFDVEQGRLTA